MPKIEFSNLTEFEKWLKDIIQKREYRLYVDATNLRIVAVPYVSTEPIIYGIVNGDSLTALDKEAQRLSTTLSIPYYKTKEIEFSDFKTR